MEQKKPEIAVSHETLKTDSKASSAMKKQAGTYTDSYLLYSIINDKRDQRFQTTDGFRLAFTQDLPLYSNSPNILNGLDFSTYHQIKDNVVASMQFYSRAINSLSSTDDVRL